MIKQESLNTLEFEKVLSAIASYSRSEVANEFILSLRPFQDPGLIRERFGEIEEIRRLSQDGFPLQISSYVDIGSLIEKLKPEGSVLEGVELSIIGNVLGVLRDLAQGLSGRDNLVHLQKRAGFITGFPGVLKTITRSVDSEGAILDSASHELRELRGRIRGLEGRIRKRLEDIVRERNITPFLQTDFITRRSGRWVIPVRMDAKGEISGVVHDVSRSGETAFMEPLEIIGLSNELENLYADEKAEEIRILRTISGNLRAESAPLKAEFEALIYIDMLQSAARFAETHRLHVPEINDLSFIRLEKGRHPILMLQGQEVVPLDLVLGQADTVMVITGPNTGGKTIAIKTVGLLLLMALTGLPIPASSGSSFPLAKSILVDIGDEQSIEQNLSTFSAHISHISQILKDADRSTVILMDELGTGTDPAQGAAISCAVLHDLKGKKALVFATTHLTDIMAYVHRMPGMVNASMEFDPETLTPLYRLKTGEPGESHALEVAKRYGLPESTLRHAREITGHMAAEFHSLIRSLKEKRQEFEKEFSLLKMKEAGLNEKEVLLQKKLREIEDERKTILEKAYSEAAEKISDIKRELNAILLEVKEDRKKARAAGKRLAALEEEISRKSGEFSSSPPLSINELNEGDMVFLKSISRDVQITGIDRKRFRIKVIADDKELEIPISMASVAQGKRGKQNKGLASLRGEKGEPGLRLELLGLRVDEAISKVERFLNDASLNGVPQAVIVHGIGTGALLKAIREYLKGHPLVASFRAGERFEGGNGVTIITLK